MPAGSQVQVRVGSVLERGFILVPNYRRYHIKAEPGPSPNYVSIFPNQLHL